MSKPPPINTKVMLDVPGWAEPFRSRVEDLEDLEDLLVVSDPLVGDDDYEPAVGTSMILSWFADRGPSEMPVSLVRKDKRYLPRADPPNLYLWHLRAEGPVTIVQRRRHARLATLLPLKLCASSRTIEGHLVDISEGGARAAVTHGDEVGVGDRYSVTFEVDGRPVSVDGHVVRIEFDGKRVYAGCRFVDVSPAQTDAIRKFVFNRQAEERRSRSGR